MEYPQADHGHQHIYYVFYRQCPDSPWTNAGGTYHRRDAQAAVNAYVARGFNAYYR